MRRRLRLRPRSLACWALMLVFIVVYVANNLLTPIDVRHESFHFRNKCPACFGETFCPALLSGRVRLDNQTRWLERLFNVKNVFRATLTDVAGKERKIILKKLGHDSELTELDMTLCHMTKRGSGCHSPSAVGRVVESLEVGQGAPTHLDYQRLKDLNHRNELFVCASSPEFVNKLEESALAAGIDRKNLATLVVLGNTEPLVVSAFSFLGVFPEFLGACGRLAAFADAGGPTVASYASEKWTTRVAVARASLDAALKLTAAGLYLTDWSPDNLALSQQDGRVLVVDAEDVVAVDLQSIKELKPPGWDQPLTSTCPDGSDAFCYSSADLCSRAESDLNLLGVCGGLLDPQSPWGLGLLHTPPAEVMRKHPLFHRFLTECSNPSNPGGRFEAAKELREILRHL